MATDWSTLKVVDLKAELKKRGEVVTGLKADLVARLVELDASDVSKDAQAGDDVEVGSTLIEAPSESVAPIEVAHTESEAASSAGKERPPAASNEAQDSTTSDPTSQPAQHEEIAAEEISRKRRSRSPPPSSNDTPRKRVRTGEDQPHTQDSKQLEIDEVVTTANDAQWVEKHNGVEGVGIETDPAKEEPLVAVEHVTNGNNDSTMLEADPTAAPASPSARGDLSYENLTEPGANKDEEMRDVEVARPDLERVVEPAIHAATSALYIRDFQRPLNPSSLKDHLTDLASPPGSHDENIILNFFLDPMRTHALVEFKNISAAARVRSEIHGVVWPDESNRKELWADFIPQERVQEWRSEEESAGPRSTKKWEVIYEADPDSGELIASLREATTVPALRRPSNIEPPRGPMTAPTGPRGNGSNGFAFDRNPGPPPSGPRSDRPRFGNPGPKPMLGAHLDPRIRTTETLPILNYQYVTKDLANKRLDNLDYATTKKPYDKDGPINRYSFDNGDVLIDRGQERFRGIRPPPGVVRRGNFRDEYRGGGRGRGFGGRGGYRGDTDSGRLGRAGDDYGRVGGDFSRDERINSDRLALINGDKSRDRDNGGWRGGRDDRPSYNDSRDGGYRDRRY